MTGELDRADRVTYRLEQTFVYRYDGPIHRLSHQLRVIPPQRHGPTSLVSARLSVEGASVRRRRWRDAAGNTVVRVEADRVEEYVQFGLSATVTRDRSAGPLLLDRSAVHSPRLLRAKRLTEPTPTLRALAGLAEPASPDAAPPGSLSRAVALDLADQLCSATHEALTYEWGVTDVHTTADQAVLIGRGVCQDSAHVMLALCRIRGLAARYVSGHLVGQGGTHAWVEVVVPSCDGRAAEAVAFDPCNGRRAGAGHVTVATGRDYADVPPTSGTYSGRAAGRLTTTRDLLVLEAA